jgi:hypothetical protein
MNVSKLIEDLKTQYPDIYADVKMTSLPKKWLGHFNGVVLNEDAGTLLKEVRINLQYSVPVVQVSLVHNGCVRWANGRVIKTVPYFCKFCGNQPLSEAHADILGLPIKAAVAKMQLRVMGPNGYEFAEKPRFEVANMILCDDQWWHKCSEGPTHRYNCSRLTIKKFPHKCKNCKMLIGDASFNLKSAFKLPGLV